MELRHLVSFEKVAQYKSYSNAAKALFLSQPTITAHINELERELRVQLFYRNHSPVQLTSEGDIFLRYVKQILTLLEQATVEISNYQDGASGTLSLSISESAFQKLAIYFNRFSSAYPHIDMDLQINLSHVTIEKINCSECQLGIIKTSKPFISEDCMAYHVLGEDEGIAVFSKNCSLAKYDEIPLEALKNPRLQKVIYGKGTDFAKQIDSILKHFNVEHTTSIKMSNSNAIKLFIQRSECIVFLPAGLVQNELEQGLLETRKIRDFPPIPRYSLLIYRKDYPLSVASKRFVEYLLKALGLPTPDSME